MTSHHQPANPSRGISSRAAAANPDPYKWRAYGLAAVFVLTLPVIIIGIVIAQKNVPMMTQNVNFVANNISQSAGSPGEIVFGNTCAVCHGPTGDGVPLLGKPLRNSKFVQSQSDAELFQLIANGRSIDDPLNTSGALMPPRGAVSLDDEKIHSVVAHLREMQDPDAPHASVAAWETRSEDGGPAIAAIELTEHVGYDLFVASCSACHGRGGEGMEDLGLPLTTSGFVRGKSDKDLITFIKMGRASWDENNTTGIDMPSKGGNPAITDAQLQTIVDYIRALQKEAMGS